MSDYRPIRVGDVVRWHDITCDWAVTEIHRNGMLTIETEIVDGKTTRTERRNARQRDCCLVGQQLALDMDDEPPLPRAGATK
jgi:uncharacterized protein (UPF0218 family)